MADAPRPNDTSAPSETPPDHAHAPADAATRGAFINARYDRQTDPEKWAKQFERPGREVHDRREAIVAALAVAPGAAVADLGAGTGLFTLPFAKAVGTSGQVIAVDVQDYFLKHIEARAEKASLTNVETRKATQNGAGLEPSSVDLAFLCDVYHHLEQPAVYLESVRASLRPGGRLVVIDYDRSREGADDWLVDHIRADPATFQAEVEAAGFVLTEKPTVLEENFFFVFEIAAPKP